MSYHDFKRYLAGLLLILLISVPQFSKGEPPVSHYPASPYPDRFLSVNGIKLRYIESGTGEPIVLLSGLLFDLDASWVNENLVRMIASNYHVIALDLRGCGKSDQPRDPRQYGPQLVTDVLRLLDHLHIHQANLIGDDLGAVVAGNLCLNYPDRVSSAVLLSGGPDTIHHQEQNGTFLDVLNRTVDTLREVQSIVPLLKYLMDKDPLMNSQQGESSQAKFERQSKLWLERRDPQAMAALLSTWQQLAVQDSKLSANRIPVLAIVGSDDPTIKQVSYLKAHMAHIVMRPIQGLDWRLNGEPEVWWHVREFLLKQHGVGKKRDSAYRTGS